MSSHEGSHDTNKIATFFDEHGGKPLRDVLSAPAKPLRQLTEPVNKAFAAVADPIKAAVTKTTSSSTGSADGDAKPDAGMPPTHQEVVSETSSVLTQVSQASTSAVGSIIKGASDAVEGAAKGSSQAFHAIASGSKTVVKKVVVQPLQHMSEQVKHGASTLSKGSHVEQAPDKEEEADDGVPAAPPDKQLESMDVVIQKTLKGVSVREWYENCWSEGQGTDKPAFYGPWLEATGKLNINVEDWDFSQEGSPFVGDWDKEEYSQKRKVTFAVEGSYPGAGQAHVTHTQYCRYNEDRCVLSMTSQMKNIPFADSFQVQIRWVATRCGSKDLLLQVGLYVLFLKQVIVAGKIRSGTTAKTTETQRDLLARMKVVCGADTAEETYETNELASTGPSGELALTSLLKKVVELLSYWFPFMKPHEEDEDDIEREMSKIRDHLHTIANLPMVEGIESESEGERYILTEFDYVQESLDRILLKFLDKPHAPETTPVEHVERSNGIFQWGQQLLAPLFQFTEAASDQAVSIERRLLGSTDFSVQESNSDFAAAAAPDKVLEAMDVVIDKFVENSSVQSLYDICFSEVALQSFYGQWLESSGKREVEVEQWETAKEGDGYEGAWSREKYQKRRTVVYKMDRKASLGGDPVVAHVKQSQLCRFEGKHTFIWESTVETSGIPFGDTFSVQIRWVATNLEGGMNVKVGIFVMFVKQSLLRGKIRAGVTTEATKAQLDLFRNARAVLVGRSAQASGEIVLEEEMPAQSHSFMDFLNGQYQTCVSAMKTFTHIYPETMIEVSEAIAKQMKLVETKIKSIGPFLEHHDAEGSSEKMRYVVNQLEVAHESLDNIIVWHGNHTEGRQAVAQTVAAASFE